MKKNIRKLLFLFIIFLVMGILLAGISNGFEIFTGWASFTVSLLLMGLLVKFAWTMIQKDNPPKWLLVGVVVAIAFRLLLGVIWYAALPEFGYDSDVNQAGYVMSDAFKRDSAAWELSQSELSLLDSFRGYSESDQYGGLLFFSASVYRFLGTSVHQPLLIIIFTSTFSGLAVCFGWGLAKQLWNEKIGKWVVWSIALYPELALLGSSQMREAFTPTLALISTYFFAKWWNEREKSQFVGILLPLLIMLVISNPTLILTIGMLVAVGLSLSDWALFEKKWLWIIVVGGGIVGIGVSYFIFPEFFNHWLQASKWEKYLAGSSSGWMQRQFERMPIWSHVPFVVSYGVFRPMLPSALVASGVLIWKIIGVWRALGWTMLLVMLIYATFLSVRYFKKDKKALALILMQWGIVFITSYRGGGDQWDSPRYRAVFAGFQLILMAWAIYIQKKEKDPWMRRAIIATVIMIIWFIPWYLRRYVDLPFKWLLVDLPDAVGVPLAIIFLYWLVDWLLGKYQEHRTKNKTLTNNSFE